MLPPFDLSATHGADEVSVVHCRAPQVMSVENIPQGRNMFDDMLKIEEGDPTLANCAVKPRGHKTTMQGAKRDASTIVLEETLKELIVEKEVTSAKRYKIKCQDKEEQMNTYLEVKKVIYS